MSAKRNRGMTLVELLVVVATIAVLVALLLPTLSHVKNAGRSARCVSNIRQVATAFTIYAENNRDLLPDDSAPETWDQALRDHVPESDIYRCPGDPAGMISGLSYGWRGNAAVSDPAASLSGRRLTAASKRPSLVLAFDALSNWHAIGFQNGATVDTSAHSYAVADLTSNLEIPIQ